MTHPVALVNRSLELAGEGFSTSEVARRLGVPRGTVRDWLAGRVPGGFHRDGVACGACGGLHDLGALPPAYVYLLGMYLGDGCLSAHRRGVFKLRVSLDNRYPAIGEEVEAAIHAVMPGNRIGRVWNSGWHEVYAYSKSWPCLFPQHGPGRKHERVIELTAWQRELVERRPDLLVRGLIQSDGCRFQNTGRGWSHPRYCFDNRSAEIRRIFCDACDLLGLRWTTSGRYTVYVSRKADVALLDRFVGPKR
ncbi:MAG TPA: helix-turn-helix domain-containing protein [Thermoleophilaceae bacterium]|nr:helix-turn-helix domain-containing protein [Thermoleophilaceae bacterium]